MNKQYKRVLAAREGGHVKRCHTTPHIGEYTVGKHSFDAANLILLLHPDPSIRLIKAIMWHDLGERWAGDLPYPAKVRSEALSIAYEMVESEVRFEHDLAIPVLSSNEEEWLSCVDKLELLLWAHEQWDLGNTRVREYIYVLQDWFTENWHNVPVEIQDFVGYLPELPPALPQYHLPRLSDMSKQEEENVSE